MATTASSLQQTNVSDLFQCLLLVASCASDGPCCVCSCFSSTPPSIMFLSLWNLQEESRESNQDFHQISPMAGECESATQMKKRICQQEIPRRSRWLYGTEQHNEGSSSGGFNY